MSIITNVSSEQIANLIDRDIEKNPELQTNIVTINGVEVYAPSSSGKYKDFHRVKVTAMIPKNIIVGDHIIDFRGFLVLEADKCRFIEEHRKQD